MPRSADIIEAKVLGVVKKKEAAPAMGRVVAKVRAKDSSITEAAAKRAVWRLLDRGKLTLSEGWELKVPAKSAKAHAHK